MGCYRVIRYNGAYEHTCTCFHIMNSVILLASCQSFSKLMLPVSFLITIENIDNNAGMWCYTNFESNP